MITSIRFARGYCSRGAFIAALSSRGLVAFDFLHRADDAIERLQARFPGAVVEEDSEGLALTVATLSRALGSAEDGAASNAPVEASSPVLGVVASINRIVRRDGSVAGGRACAASYQAARKRVLPCIPGGA
jgi:hypothetical protein